MCSLVCVFIGSCVHGFMCSLIRVLIYLCVHCLGFHWFVSPKLLYIQLTIVFKLRGVASMIAFLVGRLVCLSKKCINYQKGLNRGILT